MLIFGEFPIVLNYPDIFGHYFWASMTAAGVFGLAIGYVTGLQVKARHFLFLFENGNCH
jgi:hypothetical protein